MVVKSVVNGGDVSEKSDPNTTRKFTTLLVVLSLIQLILLSSCSIRVTSYLALNPSTYQTGETLGQGDYELRGTLSTSPVYKTSAEIEYDRPDSMTVETGFPAEGYIFGGNFQYGLTDRFDFLFDLYMNQAIVFIRPGARVFLKYRVGPVNSPLAVSIMPGAGYILGSSGRDREENFVVDEDDMLEIESSMYLAELHLPISYRLDRDLIFTFGPLVTWTDYEAPIRGIVEGYKHDEVVQLSEMIPGISIGAQYDRSVIEMTVLDVDGSLHAAFGLAIRF